MRSRLSPFQHRILDVVAGLGWTLTGGGALAGFHLGHRETRDLDLFWHGRSTLDHLPAEIARRLRDVGLTVDTLQHAPGFHQLRVSDAQTAIPVDLVADPSPCVEMPTEVSPGVQVDTPREILANKLTALLSRWAPRDLVDVQALLGSGISLDSALRDAGRKDGGFSPPTLAWVLASSPSVGLDDAMLAFRDELIRQLVRADTTA
ncbi:MAG: nucleotidyl transferase AbiEii/AbiGii toxin family protein [Myxococcales bacterium]|nr:nucleotidyl transferase AbiEii/AbiGii toxin family protein [Myxococcales bacterium]MBT9556500.1 nucleotidyl transferase AbiEii/AbiGii toxin family protein [Myxococcales bacterium]